MLNFYYVALMHRFQPHGKGKGIRFSKEMIRTEIDNAYEQTKEEYYGRQ